MIHLESHIIYKIVSGNCLFRNEVPESTSVEGRGHTGIQAYIECFIGGVEGGAEGPRNTLLIPARGTPFLFLQEKQIINS